MKFLQAVVAVFVVALFVSETNAQCRSRAFVNVNSGFSNNIIIPQSVVVPQSTSFFSGGNVAFVNTPQVFAVAQPSFINVNPVQQVQQIDIRRGLFGNVRRVKVNSVVQPLGVAAPAAININGRRARIFIQ